MCSHKLKGIPETLLIALWARAAATREPEPIIRDDEAVEMVSRIDYDFSRFGCRIVHVAFEKAK